MQQQLADNRVRWVNQQELHRPDSRRRSRRRRKQAGREKTLEILGSLPDCNGPPNARITVGPNVDSPVQVA